MTTRTKILLGSAALAAALGAVVLSPSVVLSGSLTPPSAPGSTMHSLEEIYRKLPGSVPESWQSMPTWAQVSGGSSVHMTLTGATQGTISGSCAAVGREGTIRVVGLEHAVRWPIDLNTGLATGTRAHEPLRVLKFTDKSSAKLYAALVTGETLTDVALKFYWGTSEGGEEQYWSIQLSNARIIEIHHDFPNVETVILTYQTITWTWMPDAITYTDSWASIPKNE